MLHWERATTSPLRSVGRTCAALIITAVMTLVPGVSAARSGSSSRVLVGASGQVAPSVDASILLAGPIGRSAWEASASVKGTPVALMLLESRLGLSVETVSRPVDAPVRGTLVGLEEWLADSTLARRMAAGDGRYIFDPDLGGLAVQRAGRIRRVSALRVTPVLQYQTGEVQAYAGATWAGSRSPARNDGALGLACGAQRRSGAFIVSCDLRSGRGVRYSVGRGYTYSSPADSFVQFSPLVAHSRHTYWDTRLRATVVRDAWMATGTFGYRAGRESFGPRASGGLELARGVMENVTLFLSSGYEPSVPEQQLPGRRVAQIGLSLSGRPRAFSPCPPENSSMPQTDDPARGPGSMFRLDPAGWDRLEIACRIPGARAVLASGDFTDWTPRPMTPGPGGWWRLVVLIEPGPHRISVAVDGGAWLAPPGLPSMGDDFGGSVGLFVAP